jgi:hypothetical protein
MHGNAPHFTPKKLFRSLFFCPLANVESVISSQLRVFAPWVVIHCFPDGPTSIAPDSTGSQ